jgi:light-regulated signal transduction histidine kinase (bacteriophytochrome)
MRYGTQNNLEVWDMTDKELARLGRRELLELLIQQSKEMAQLQQELDEAKAQLARREITVESCGTLAEAALKLSGIFEAADAAAAQYLENIKRRGEVEQ